MHIYFQILIWYMVFVRRQALVLGAIKNYIMILKTNKLHVAQWYDVVSQRRKGFILIDLATSRFHVRCPQCAK